MSGTIKDYKDWLEAWENIERVAHIQLEQATLIIPVIKNKIIELEEVQEVKDGG